MMNRLIVTECVDPWTNLAVEETLCDTQEAGGATMYLWQNKNTVVIGRSQNAWKECRVELLEGEGGKLARRSSGGGAVFHDLGNLNFTFVLPREGYDLSRQFSVIANALSRFGICSVVSGRNDLVLDTGEKFSGNAFRFTERYGMQHGTLLVDVDMDRLTRYLAPSPRKLAAKGVNSVRSRVKNLSTLSDALTVGSLRDALSDAFEAEYGEAAHLTPEDLDPAMIAEKRERYASWDWRFGKTPAFDVSIGERFPWGEIDLQLTCREGRVSGVNVFTDAMDETLAERLQANLIGAYYTAQALADRIERIADMPEGFADWMRVQAL